MNTWPVTLPEDILKEGKEVVRFTHIRHVGGSLSLSIRPVAENTEQKYSG